MPRRGLVVAVLFCACSHPTPWTLSQAASKGFGLGVVVFDLSPTTDEVIESVQLFVPPPNVGGPPFEQLIEPNCPYLDVSVTLGDETMREVGSGGWQSTGLDFATGGTRFHCVPQTWQLPARARPPNVPETKVTMTSRSFETWTMTVNRLYASRSLTRLRDEAVQGRGSFEMSWSPAVDSMRGLREFSLYAPHGGGKWADGGELGTASAQLTYDAGRVIIEVPDVAPGNYELRLVREEVGYDRKSGWAPSFSRCDGPIACDANIGNEWQVCETDGGCITDYFSTVRIMVGR